MYKIVHLIATALRWQFYLIKDRHRTATKQADGETVPTIVRAVGRVDSRGIKFEVVSINRPGTNPIGHR